MRGKGKVRGAGKGLHLSGSGHVAPHKDIQTDTDEEEERYLRQDDKSCCEEFEEDIRSSGRRTKRSSKRTQVIGYRGNRWNLLIHTKKGALGYRLSRHERRIQTEES